MPQSKPSDVEMQVLSALWEHGPSTVRDVMDRLPDGKPRAYTTVLTILQGMDRKGLVTRTQEGTAHVFHPAVERPEVERPLMRKLLSHVFGGDPSRVVQALLESTDVSDGEIREIRKLLSSAAKANREGKQ